MRFGRVLSCCAALLIPCLASAADTGPTPWIAATGNLGATTMGDVNSLIAFLNTGLGFLNTGLGLALPAGSMNQVNFGFGGSGMVGVDFSENYSAGIGYDYVTASTKLNAPATALNFRFPANLVHADLMYRVPSNGPFVFGFGAGGGVIMAGTKIDGTIAGATFPSISLSANGPMLESFLTGDLKASPKFAITTMAGYRYAKTGNLELAGTTVPMTLDYSGAFARLGFKLMFGGPPRDSDGDGVPDHRDKCPNTPGGARVDEDGCPIDSDGDGVYDGIDQCPGSPKGCIVDAKGCPHDEDSDGVCDGLDQCPGSPKGCVVDAKGCPLDSDGDGVCDGLDRCPGTAPGVKVDQDGCPISMIEKETELLDTGTIRLNDVRFETAKWDIKPESYPVLNEVGAILSKWPQLRIEIGGHTDWRGTEPYNQRLSEKRARAVLEYLTAKFSALNPSQYSAKGYGESSPIATNRTASGMAQNRRVEFRVLNREVLRKEIEKRKTKE